MKIYKRLCKSVILNQINCLQNILPCSHTANFVKSKGPQKNFIEIILNTIFKTLN
jgi:hypothetical protein